MLTVTRRTAALLALASVLFRTLGGTHAECADAAAAGGWADGRATVAAMLTQVDRAHHGQPAGRNADQAPAQGHHDCCSESESSRSDSSGQPAHSPASCEMAAQCTLVAPDATIRAESASLVLAERPRIAMASMPRGFTAEPEFPPPRV